MGTSIIKAKSHALQTLCPQLRAHLPSHRPLPTLLPVHSDQPSPRPQLAPSGACSSLGKRRRMGPVARRAGSGGTGRPCYAPLCHILLAKLYSQYFLYFFPLVWFPLGTLSPAEISEYTLASNVIYSVPAPLGASRDMSGHCCQQQLR